MARGVVVVVAESELAAWRVMLYAE
jgi:hypothetical protein